MTNTELIRQEIERLKAELPKQDLYTTIGADSICAAKRYDELLSFIDSLPEEKEIDLDEKITKYRKDISSLYGAVGKEITRFDFDDVCRYFYELGRLSNK